LAKWITDTMGKRVMLSSTDVYRPAAIQQLEKLASEISVPFSVNVAGSTAMARAEAALVDARNHTIEVLIVDTAGRQSVDEAMMAEIAALHARLEPAATLFVVDAMTGQDAARTAHAFHQRLPLTGVVLTKADGDARGGAALSVRAVTGAPLLFLGTGERVGGLERFDPERVARRMLGMGDIVGLVEAAQRADIDQDDARRMAERVKAGAGFTLQDFREQMHQMEKMGGMGALMAHLPAQMGKVAKLPADGDRSMRRLGGIIDSMTPKERTHPDLIKASRKRRIAAGSGTTVPEVNRLLRQFADARTMMKRLGKGGGVAKLLRGLGGKLPGM